MIMMFARKTNVTKKRGCVKTKNKKIGVARSRKIVKTYLKTENAKSTSVTKTKRGARKKQLWIVRIKTNVKRVNASESTSAPQSDQCEDDNCDT